MKIKEVYGALERFAPLPLQEDWDNAGLQVGLTEAEVSGALLCLDVTEEIVREAMAKGCNLIVSHHPLIFRKLAQVSDTDIVQRSVMLAIKNDITIISMHTNLDSALGGVNHEMAERLGLQNIRFLNPQQLNGVEYGMGTIGELEAEISAEQFVALVKKTFNCGCVITNPLIKRPIRRVAMMGGAGDCAIGLAEKAGTKLSRVLFQSQKHAITISLWTRAPFHLQSRCRMTRSGTAKKSGSILYRIGSTAARCRYIL